MADENKPQVQPKKRSKASIKFEEFLTNDIQKIKTFVVDDVIKPEVKRILRGILDIMLDGNPGRASSKPKNGGTPYNTFYGGATQKTRNNNSSYSYDIYAVDTKEQSDERLDQLADLLDRYQAVSVADYYSLYGASTHVTDQNYGWTTLNGVRSVYTRDGWVLNLPDPLYLLTK